MADSFQKLREILQTGKIPADTSQFSEAGYKRLLETLDAAGTSDAPGMEILRLCSVRFCGGNTSKRAGYHQL